MTAAIDLNVSRETFSYLERYVELLTTWTSKINLISKSSVSDVWERHIRDSVQVYQATSSPGDLWLDIGSGGGLPGLVVAILLREEYPDTNLVLVESDFRKSTFLRTVIRELNLSAKVLAHRVEAIEPMKADTISARALGHLSDLLSYSEIHLAVDGTCLFPKGQSWNREVAQARELWNFNLDAIESKTDQRAAILKIGGISRV